MRRAPTCPLRKREKRGGAKKKHGRRRYRGANYTGNKDGGNKEGGGKEARNDSKGARDRKTIEGLTN